MVVGWRGGTAALESKGRLMSTGAAARKLENNEALLLSLVIPRAFLGAKLEVYVMILFLQLKNLAPSIPQRSLAQNPASLMALSKCPTS